jgi:serine/threonine-protein kinase
LATSVRVGGDEFALETDHAAHTDPMSATDLATALSDRYRIDRELGAGGMATVYLARDLRHDRNVAIKVLRPELAAVIGAERFAAEIKTTANLQHPHLLPLFDSGTVEGTAFYVMPLVEGESLRARLQRERQLPVGEAIQIANEVADALQYAHAHGVIHRDIKPENILLQNGHALVADFGIALAVEQAGEARMTQTGLSLGTPQYMSPEQAMGERNVDARTDIYSLGAITYEMLAGEPPFTGPNAQAIVAQVLTAEPPLASIRRPNVPPHVDVAVQTALEKLPADRFSTVAAFAAALRGDASDVPSRRKMARTTSSPAVRWALSTAVLAAGVAVGWLAHRQRVPNTFPVRFILSTDSLHSLEFQYDLSLAVSADGRRVAYVARTRSGALIYERPLDTTDAHPLRGTALSGQPAYSPDGRWLAFEGPSGIMRAPVGGGDPQLVTSAPKFFNVAGMTWTRDSRRIVYASVVDRALYAASDPGTPPVRLTHPDSASLERHIAPAVSPDGRLVLFTSIRGSEGATSVRLGVLDLASGAVRFIDTPALAPSFVAPDTVMYGLADGRLVRQSFVGSPRVLGNDATIVVDHVRVIEKRFPQYAVSMSGVLVFWPAADTATVIARVDRRGAEQVLFTTPGGENLRISPDRSRIAYLRQSVRPEFQNELWTYTLATGIAAPVTREFHDINDPAWSRDGRLLTFTGRKKREGWRIVVTQADGAGAARPVTPPGNYYQPEFTPDGRRVVFLGIRSSFADGDLFSVPLAGGSPLDTVLATPYDESAATVSPDGHWLAYHSDASGQYEVYVRPFLGSGTPTVVSENGGREPAWSPDGREIFYRAGAQFMSASITSRDPFRVGERRVLFSGPYNFGFGNREYDVDPDGQHFIVSRSPTKPYLVVQVNAVRR